MSTPFGSDAFIDGDSLDIVDLPDVSQSVSINGQGTGFPGLADEGYSMNQDNINEVNEYNGA